MDWLQSNWIWFAIAAGMIAMHFFGHGGHSHGRDDGEPDSTGGNGAKDVNDPTRDGSRADNGQETASAAAPPKQHRHSY